MIKFTFQLHHKLARVSVVKDLYVGQKRLGQIQVGVRHVRRRRDQRLRVVKVRRHVTS